MFRWGMVGHGTISERFLAAARSVDEHDVVAVAGRSADRVAAYGSRHDIGACVVGAAELASCDIDAAYICTLHPNHLESALTLLEAGIPVLVEKPMTPTLGQTRQLAEAAQANDCFAMEAMWTRFLPVYETVTGWIEDGAIGDVLHLRAAFGFRAPVIADHRLFAASLGGGSILDVGVYPLALGQHLFGAAPIEAHATGVVGSTGVDETVAIAASYPGGRIAQYACAIRSDLDDTAVITGSEGTIEIPVFWGAESATLQRKDTEPETVVVLHRTNGFEYQIEHVADQIRLGLTDSSRMPLRHSAELASLCENLRHQVGVTYPFESDQL